MKTHSYKSLNKTGFHRVAYTEWGSELAEKTLICVHGLTRNGRDFDALAGALSKDFRTACPDVVGRGKSDWLGDKSAYGYPQYLTDMTALIARLNREQVDWVGTSMGGLIGMFMAMQPNSPIRRLVLVDVGPFIPKAALLRISFYVGTDPTFADIGEVEAYLRDVAAPFGPLTDAQWRHLADHGMRRRDDGSLTLHYDPGIAEAFNTGPIDDIDLWPVWDAIRCPVLVLRGETSDLLLPETAAEMAVRGPMAQIEEIAGCGHTPMVMDDRQIGLVGDWLRATE
ncbi:MAG: alpha/beta hydrolase [Alphaproteobacteria bacterium]|nr:alpha/beta hydrolase [Alphaproteobacteria bacterium]